jgi:hypothetical protein
MKRLLLIVLLLTGCATATFEKKPDGTVTVSYTRFLTTSTELTASVGDAKVTSKGQGIDAVTLSNILTAAGAGK